MEVGTPSAIPDGGKHAFAPKRAERVLSRLLVTLLIVVFTLTLNILPARAAIDLEYFNAIASSAAVLLEWSTGSEYNVAGFEILKQREGQPESEWHRIGFFNAKGDTNNGAQYDTLVTNIASGVSYCFRLREVTTDDEPGEVRDLCGYGLSITPTPSGTSVSSTPSTSAGSPSSATAAAGTGAVLFPTATPDPLVQQQLQPTPTIDPFAAQQQQPPTPDPFQQQSPLPTPDPFAQAAQQPVVPFATPTIDPFAPATATLDPFGPVTPTIDPFAAVIPTIDPFAPVTPTVDPFSTATPTFDPFATATATIDPFAQSAAAAIDPVTGWQFDPATGWPVDPLSGLPTEPAQAALIVQQRQVLQSQSPLPFPTDTPALIPTATAFGAGAVVAAPGEPTPTPTAIYVVVTAAPANAGAGEGVALLVTPWPTAISTPLPVLAALFAPTAQNLTVLMLCFIFLSATVIGGLGLMAVVLYLRSRAQREDDRARLRARH